MPNKLKRDLAITEKALGPDHPDVGASHRTFQSSLNNFIRAQHERLRDRDPERLGGVQVDRQFEGLVRVGSSAPIVNYGKIFSTKRATPRP
jgi:hypothetical protein